MPNDEELNNQGGFDERPIPPPLDKNQKIAAASLAVFAVLIVVLWVAQLRNNIYGPFNRPVGQNQAALETPNSDEVLKTKDTDGDGLSDYDELNLYRTSPYLADTDSDGYKDSEEIKNNADPNCPAGRDCGSGSPLENVQATSTPGAANDTLNSLLNQFGAVNPPAGQAGPANLANPPALPTGQAGLNSDQLKALKNIDAASLRELLLQAGLPKATLDKISDADLLKSYGETLTAGQ